MVENISAPTEVFELLRCSKDEQFIVQVQRSVIHTYFGLSFSCGSSVP